MTRNNPTIEDYDVVWKMVVGSAKRNPVISLGVLLNGQNGLVWAIETTRKTQKRNSRKCQEAVQAIESGNIDWIDARAKILKDCYQRRTNDQ